MSSHSKLSRGSTPLTQELFGNGVVPTNELVTELVFSEPLSLRLLNIYWRGIPPDPFWFKLVGVAEDKDVPDLVRQVINNKNLGVNISAYGRGAVSQTTVVTASNFGTESFD